MYTFSEAPETLPTLNQAIVERVKIVLDGVEPHTADMKVQSNTEVVCPSGCFLHVRDGVVVEKDGARTLWVHESGDVVGLENVATDFSGLGHDRILQTEFAAVVDVYEWCSVSASIRKNAKQHQAWSELLVLDRQRMAEILMLTLPCQGPAFPEHLRFEAGEVIVCEGDPADCVYTLVDGEAEVTVEGVCVGSIEADETFGALAALCQTDRTATVVAKTDCSVWRWPTENFHEMVASRPGAVTKLVQDLGRKISNLNQKMIELSEPV